MEAATNGDSARAQGEAKATRQEAAPPAEKTDDPPAGESSRGGRGGAAGQAAPEEEVVDGLRPEDLLPRSAVPSLVSSTLGRNKRYVPRARDRVDDPYEYEVEASLPPPPAGPPAGGAGAGRLPPTPSGRAPPASCPPRARRPRASARGSMRRGRGPCTPTAPRSSRSIFRRPPRRRLRHRPRTARGESAELRPS
jgi:hypothetical protein